MGPAAPASLIIIPGVCAFKMIEIKKQRKELGFFS